MNVVEPTLHFSHTSHSANLMTPPQYSVNLENSG